MTENISFEASVSENLDDECGLIIQASTEKTSLKESDNFLNPFQRNGKNFML